MKIPNKVSLAMAAGFFLTLPLTWQGVPMLTEHVLVGLTIFMVGFIMFSLGWLGGGDAKLLAAIALWMSWADLASLIVAVTLFGAALGLFLLITPKFMPIWLRGTVLSQKLYQGGKDMPYGLALAAGALYVWPKTQIGLALLG